MFDSSSYVNPTPLAHADTSRDVLPRGGTSQTHHPLSAALTLQQCLFGVTEERYHQLIDRSGLTPTSRLQRSVGQRRLTEEHLGSRRTLRVLPLTPPNRRLRLEWCPERRNWTAAEWNQVLFSDESRFNLTSDDNRVRVWRPRGERLNPAFAYLHTAPTAGMMVWRVIAYITRSPLVLLRGTMTAQCLVVRASDSRPEGLGSMPDATKHPPSLNAEIVEVEIEVVSPSIVHSENFTKLNRTVTCMVLKTNDRRTSSPCNDEFRGTRSDYVRQVVLEITTTLFFDKFGILYLFKLCRQL
ncbi:transposable element Tcb1 transposase [Trichonephila clavipes]|uniref:Transposable element Tcb1 transposase n=1 Tax=Trichonephila clavipes TaxID=2585209 RepID=A0A8X6W929_TRICX|nr:transposable element Tcb1 transposase [Trichonephila clavipes]